MMYYIPESGARNRLGNDEIRRRFAEKAGHWELIDPDIADIKKLSVKADVKCLDCGKEQTVKLGYWLSPNNLKHGCPYCGGVRK